MGSQMNFDNNHCDASFRDRGSGFKPAETFNLTRQSSIYSMTFDEFQNACGGPGKDFGSMNMDELMKSIWTAEETQTIGSAPLPADGGFSSTNLQRQGSLTIPRTLSQKTVDEVWKDLIKESDSGVGGNFLEKEPTFGEITLEEFLMRAVVREDPQQIETPNSNGFYSKNSNSGFSLGGFQQPIQNNVVLSSQILDSKNVIAINGTAVGLSQPLYPKSTTVSFGSSINSINNVQTGSPGPRNGLVSVADPHANGGLVQNSGLRGGTGLVGLAQSPVNSLQSTMMIKKVESPSYSPPVPYAFGRGRRSGGGFEKVVERRQRRMIKNRESAARSRARKQAYTLELEDEVAKLKEANHELQKKQAEIIKAQKNQLLDKMKSQLTGKRQCLRRTLTGPW